MVTVRFIFVKMSGGDMNGGLSTVNFILHCPWRFMGITPFEKTRKTKKKSSRNKKFGSLSIKDLLRTSMMR